MSTENVDIVKRIMLVTAIALALAAIKLCL